MATTIQLRKSEQLAKKLREAGYGSCVFSDGRACAGARGIVKVGKETFLSCGNHFTISEGKQKPALMTQEEAKACTRKRPHKTPFGP